MLGLIMFVERLREPLPVKVFVNIGVHSFRGNVRFVLPSNTNCPSGLPFIADIVSVVPFTLMPVIFGGNASETVKMSAPPLIASDVAVPAAMPEPAAEYEVGRVPATVPPPVAIMV